MILSKANFQEYFTAKVVLTGGVEREFKCAIYEDKSKAWNTPIQNLISSVDNLTLRTSWNLPFKTGLRVLFQGEWFKINGCKPLRTDINETVARMWRRNNVYWVLELTR